MSENISKANENAMVELVHFIVKYLHDMDIVFMSISDLCDKLKTIGIPNVTFQLHKDDQTIIHVSAPGYAAMCNSPITLKKMKVPISFTTTNPIISFDNFSDIMYLHFIIADNNPGDIYIFIAEDFTCKDSSILNTSNDPNKNKRFYKILQSEEEFKGFPIFPISLPKSGYKCFLRTPINADDEPSFVIDDFKDIINEYICKFATSKSICNEKKKEEKPKFTNGKYTGRCPYDKPCNQCEWIKSSNKEGTKEFICSSPDVFPHMQELEFKYRPLIINPEFNYLPPIILLSQSNVLFFPSLAKNSKYDFKDFIYVRTLNRWSSKGLLLPTKLHIFIDEETIYYGSDEFYEMMKYWFEEIKKETTRKNGLNYLTAYDGEHLKKIIIHRPNNNKSCYWNMLRKLLKLGDEYGVSDKIKFYPANNFMIGNNSYDYLIFHYFHDDNFNKGLGFWGYGYIEYRNKKYYSHKKSRHYIGKEYQKNIQNGYKVDPEMLNSSSNLESVLQDVCKHYGVEKLEFKWFRAESSPSENLERHYRMITIIRNIMRLANTYKNHTTAVNTIIDYIDNCKLLIIRKN